MGCDFCSKFRNGDKLFDEVNPLTNEIYLTCCDDYLRIWREYSYLGCYKINYCPICGEKLQHKEE